MIPRLSVLTLAFALVSLPALASSLEDQEREWGRTKNAFLSHLREEARAVEGADPFEAFRKVYHQALLHHPEAGNPVFDRIYFAGPAQLRAEARDMPRREAAERSLARIAVELARISDAWQVRSEPVTPDQAIRLIIDYGQFALLPLELVSDDDRLLVRSILRRTVRAFLQALRRDDALAKAMRSFNPIPLAVPAGRVSARANPVDPVAHRSDALEPIADPARD